MNLKTKQTLSVMFSIGGAIGTLATALLVRESAKKEQETYQTLLPFKKGNIKDILILYKVPIAVGTLTIGSIIGSTVMSNKAQASIMSMAVLADQGWRKYKHQVKSTLGLKAHEDIISGIAKKNYNDIQVPNKKELSDNRELFYDEIVGYFQANPEDVAFAYAEINEMLNTDYRNKLTDVFDFVTIGRFLKLANAELIDPDVNIEELNKWGWTMDYLVEAYNWPWIHMKLIYEKTDDGEVPIRVISWVQDPILLTENQIYSGISLSLDGLEVEEYEPWLDDARKIHNDRKLSKKYQNQEKVYEKKASIK